MSADGSRPLAGETWLRAPPTARVLDALEADGAPARFVGGCVRDGLLGRAGPDVDVDIATPLRPERVLAALARAKIRAVPTGIAHGTVTAVVGERRFEVTTLRTDVRTDGRHAEVAFTNDFEEDARRRDFTINAMSADRSGRLFDYFGGRDDLAAGRVRFVGDARQRITEDHLRILRFFRFFARFGRPPPDGDALQACRAQATTIRRLSGERVQTEMLKLLAAADPAASLELMVASGVADEVFFGEIALRRLRRLLNLRPDAPPLLRLAALVRPPPAAKCTALRVAERWRLSRDDQRRLTAAMEDTMGLPDDPALRRRLIWRLGATRFADLVSLEAADRTDDVRATLGRALDQARTFAPPSLPLTGEDVLAAGVAPGPEVGRILSEVETFWVERDFVPGRAACLARLEAIVTASSPGAGQSP